MIVTPIMIQAHIEADRRSATNTSPTESETSIAEVCVELYLVIGHRASMASSRTHRLWREMTEMRAEMSSAFKAAAYASSKVSVIFFKARQAFLKTIISFNTRSQMRGKTTSTAVAFVGLHMAASDRNAKAFFYFLVSLEQGSNTSEGIASASNSSF
jgi:hypothetical protein